MVPVPRKLGPTRPIFTVNGRSFWASRRREGLFMRAVARSEGEREAKDEMRCEVTGQVGRARAQKHLYMQGDNNLTSA
jgi:hypothetical protein